MKRLCFLAAMLVIALAGCGGESTPSATNGGATNGGTTGGTSDERRLAAATAAVDAYVAMAGASTSEIAATLPGKWMAIEGFKDAGYDAATETYWAIFDDGVPFAYFAGRQPTDAGLIAGDTRAADQLPIPSGLALLDSLGDAFGHHGHKIRDAANKHGYQATMSRGYVEDLAALKGVAGIWWDTHGGMGMHALNGAAKAPIYCLWTDSKVTSTPTAQISTMIANDELGIGGAAVDAIVNPVDKNKNGKIDPAEKMTHETHYMILPKFVTSHITLGENGFVWLDACSSVTDPTMIAAFLAKKADVYVGWDNTVSSSHNATLPAFDRLLGENASLPKDSPPYRPQNFFDVIGWLQRQGLDKVPNSSGGVATLKYFTASPENFALLRPNIEHMVIYEQILQGQKAALVITGEFGPARGYERKVTVDGTPLTITRWTTTEIECELPTTGAGTYGPVVVEANGRKSNAVPITLWKVVMTYLMDGPGTLFWKWDMVVNYRLDIHKARKKPWETPKGMVKRWSPMFDSTAKVTVGGQGPSNGGTATWTGSRASVPYGPVAPPAACFYGIGLDIDTETRKSGMNVFNGWLIVKERIVFPNGDVVNQDIPAAPVTEAFIMEFDDRYALKAGSAKFVTALGTGTLSWPNTGGVHAPDDTTQARPDRR